MSTISSSLLYQIPSSAALKAQYVGQKLKDIQAPAAIIDLAVVKKNCNLMLEAAESLKVQFRAHVKTHKVGLGIIKFERINLTTNRHPSWHNCKQGKVDLLG